MLGFQADYSKIYNELTTCKKSIADMMATGETFSYQPETDFKYSGFAGFWMRGLPYGEMLSSNNAPSAATFVSNESTWVLAEWDEMVRRTNEMLGKA